MNSRVLCRAPFIGVIIAVVLLFGLLPNTLPVRAAASLTLPRTTVPQAASVAVSGSGFTANDTVVIYVDATVAGNKQRIQTLTTSNGSGDFSTHLSLPRNIDPATYMLVARDTHNVSASQHLTVLTLLIIRPNGSNPGATVVDRHGFFVDALGFQAGETVKLQATFSTYGGNDVIQNRTATADAHGNVYNVSMYAVAGAKTGWAPVTATGQTSNKVAHGRVYVVYRPYIFISQKSITPGSAATVNGRGFVADTQVRVQITIQSSSGSQTIAVTATADGNGNFSRSIRVPSYTSAGTYTVTATDLTGGFKRYARLTVTQKPTPKPTATPKPTFHALAQIVPNVTLPNQNVAFVGSGFPANTDVTVSVTVDMRGGGTRTVSKTATTDSNGSFATTLRIPAKAAPGTYTVTASTSQAQASAQLQVLPLSAHLKTLNFRWISLWYHTVRQGTWDFLNIQSTLKTQLGIWVHVIFPNGLRHDYFTLTDHHGHWAIRFSVPRHAISRHSNQGYIAFQLWHGKQTTQSFMDFTLV